MNEDNTILESSFLNLEDSDFINNEIVIPEGKKPIRIDKFLMEKIPNTTRSKIQTAIKTNHVTVNGEDIKANYILKPGDLINFKLQKSPYTGIIIPEAIELDIVYEDDFLMVINKQPGLVVHPGHGNYSGTLVNAIAHYLGTDLPTMEGNSEDRIGLVHRIDKDTTGLMVIAKTEQAMVHLAQQFSAHTLERKYIALVWGQPDPENGTIEGNIGRNPLNRMQQIVFPDGDEGKHATTHYKTIKPMYYVSLVECQLETGRTHQIRVHMKYKGHILFNDERYGGNKIMKGTVFSKYKQFVENCFKIFPRQALHARSLGFIHPNTNEFMLFESELPQDFKELIDKWESYLDNRKKVLDEE